MRPEYMEPAMPLQDGRSPEKRRETDNLASVLRERAAALNSALNPVVQDSIGALVRSMNCYYSNLIEGHYTHPVDIEKALNKDYSNEPEKRSLQLEAAAHIYVQERIDRAEQPAKTASGEFIRWVHGEFYSRLPEELRYVSDPETEEKIPVIPGEYRKRDVKVGRHVAVPFEDVPAFIERFVAVYNPEKLGRHEQVAAAAASHHRLLWIHPFLDGNGRTARLFSHAYLKEIGIGSSLWSVSRGLARTSAKYKEMLAYADSDRKGDLDGRGSLSLIGLQDFCIYFLEQCIDQTEFMASLLKLTELLERIEFYCRNEASKGRIHKKAFRLLKEALIMGEFSRGNAADILDMSAASSSKIISELVSDGILTSETPKGKVRLGFPYKVLKYWLPGVYPDL